MARRGCEVSKLLLTPRQYQQGKIIISRPDFTLEISVFTSFCWLRADLSTSLCGNLDRLAGSLFMLLDENRVKLHC